MGKTRTDLYTDDQLEIAAAARALGHPARIAIVQYLLQSAKCICGDIVDEIGLAQSTVSQHLKVLKEEGIICGNIEGSAVCYCIDQKKWIHLEKLFSEFFPGHYKCC